MLLVTVTESARDCSLGLVGVQPAAIIGELGLGRGVGHWPPHFLATSICEAVWVRCGQVKKELRHAPPGITPYVES